MKIKISYLRYGNKFRFTPNGVDCYFIKICDNPNLIKYTVANNGVEISHADEVYVDYDSVLFKLVPGQSFYHSGCYKLYVVKLHMDKYTMVIDSDGNLVNLPKNTLVYTE